MAKIQTDFFKFIVTPLFETWHRFLDSSLSNQLIWNLHKNHCQWKKRIAREQDETIPVAGLVIPHTIDIPSPYDNRDLSVPEDLDDSEIPVTRYPCDTEDLETPTEELNPTTSVISLSDQLNVLQLHRVRVISQLETYFFKPTQETRQGEEIIKCINGCGTPPEIQITDENKTSSTWCWHISRSLSEERPQQPSKDFDSPAHSWKGSTNSLISNRFKNRRGSAPMTIGRSYLQCPSDIVGVYNSQRNGGRRWSVPVESLSDLYNSSHYKIHRESQNGFCESYATVKSEKSTKHIGTRFKLPQDKLETDNKSIYITGSPIIVSCVTSPARRGSLPTDLPISLMHSSIRLENPAKQEWYPRRRSAGEILSVLLGPSGTLTAIQTVDMKTKGDGHPRRGSDSLVLCYGILRSKRDHKNLEHANRYKFPLTLDTSNRPDWNPRGEDFQQFCANYLFSTGQIGHSGITAFSEHLCQRRASVPIGISFLSTNSGSPYRNYQDSMS